MKRLIKNIISELTKEECDLNAVEKYFDTLVTTHNENSGSTLDKIIGILQYTIDSLYDSEGVYETRIAWAQQTIDIYIKKTGLLNKLKREYGF